MLGRAGLRFAGRRLWGLATVTADAESYRPDPAGKFAIIAGAFEDNRLIDLAAMSVATRALRRRWGEAVFLGDEASQYAGETGRPLRVFSDPLGWVRNGCHGVVVLDWRRAPYRLADLPAITCDSPRLALRLQRAFERPIPAPILFAPQETETRHAA